MATRCCIRIRADGDLALWLYRHWDGYPAVTGLDLCQHLKCSRLHSSQAAHFVTRLLRSSEERAGGRYFHYEATAGAHADIEWLYDVLFIDGRPLLRVYSRPCGEDIELSVFNAALNQPMSEPDFRAYCARAARRMRGPARAYRAANGLGKPMC